MMISFTATKLTAFLLMTAMGLLVANMVINRKKTKQGQPG